MVDENTYNDILFNAMINFEEDPTKSERIIADTESFFAKYKNATSINDLNNALVEAKDLEKKHNSKMCNTILIELLVCFEKGVKQ